MDAFLDQSRTFQDAITKSFHLINTTRASLAFLSAEIQKIIDAGLDDRVISALFPTPAGTTGQNLRALTLRSDEQLEHDVATMWLFATIARYEAWAESLERDHSITDAKSACQFHSKYVNTFPSLVKVADLDAVFGASIRVDRFYLGGHQEVSNALLLFRFYKEVRNSLTHSTGHAEARLVSAADAARPAAALMTAQSGWRGAAVPAIVLGQDLRVTYALVWDTIALLQRLVFSIDAQILVSSVGEKEIEKRWKSTFGHLKIEARKVQSSSWYSQNVSTRLRVPRPWRNSPDKTWRQDQRDTFTHFAEQRGLLRVLP